MFLRLGIRWSTVWRSLQVRSSCLCLACSISSWLFFFSRFSSLSIVLSWLASRPLVHRWSSLVSCSCFLWFSSIILAMASSWEIFRMVFRGPFRNRLVALITVVARLKVFIALMARPKPALPRPDLTGFSSLGAVSEIEITWVSTSVLLGYTYNYTAVVYEGKSIKLQNTNLRLIHQCSDLLDKINFEPKKRNCFTLLVFVDFMLSVSWKNTSQWGKRNHFPTHI